MKTRHPSETDLALLAGGDCGLFTRLRLNRHVAQCGDCQDTLASFGELRSEVRQTMAADGAMPAAEWDRMAGEMRANIHLGLVAGECVREASARSSHWGWRPQLAIGTAGVLLLAGASLFLRGLLPHENAPGVTPAVVLESTGAGVEVRSDTGSSMTLLNQGEGAGDQTVTSQGAIRASYVDGNTGTVTVTSVYAE